MPTYEFRCPNGHEFEKFYRTISGAEAQAACPVCREAAERIMSATGFAFKGSGFYLTDYGKNAHRDKGSAPKSTEPSAGDGAAAKSETKGEGAKSSGSDGATASTSSSAPAPAESKPTAPKKSTGE
jgi:putative FmdB family regulatory protein